MRIQFLFLGLLLVFAGLTLTGFSQMAVPIRDEELQIIREGLRDMPEILNVSLTQGDRFVAKYSGGGSYVDPNEVIVNVFDPYGNITSGISYATQFQEGILANYTGSYKIQIGAPGLIDPSRPFQMNIFEMVVTNRIEHPQSYLLPYALACVIIGAVVCVYGLASKPKRVRSLKAIQKDNKTRSLVKKLFKE